MPKIYGIMDMQVNLTPNEIPTMELTLAMDEGFDARQLWEYKNWDDMFPGDVVIKCQFCGQWGARKCACLHCGGAIE